MPPEPAIRLSAAVRRDVINHTRRAWPEECCGILIGRAGGSAGAPAVVSARAVDNIVGGTASRRRFRIAPAAIAAAGRDARAEGLEVLGFYHSHPAGPARPSSADIADASAWPGYLHLICAPNDPAHLRGYITATGHWPEASLS